MRLRTLIVSLTAAAALTAVATEASAAVNAAPYEQIRFLPGVDGRAACLGNQSSFLDGLLQIAPCAVLPLRGEVHATPAQRWSVRRVGAGYWFVNLQVAGVDRCATANAGALNLVTLETCGTRPGQEWHLEDGHLLVRVPDEWEMVDAVGGVDVVRLDRSRPGPFAVAAIPG